MKILVINGANLHLLGIREPEIYGTSSYADLVALLRADAAENGDTVSFFQSNHEGEIADRIAQAYFDGTEGIVINPGAFTHTSVAIRDAVASVGIPAVEVHISDVSAREDFRQISFLREVCAGTVAGCGFDGYCDAIRLLKGTARTRS